MTDLKILAQSQAADGRWVVDFVVSLEAVEILGLNRLKLRSMSGETRDLEVDGDPWLAKLTGPGQPTEYLRLTSKPTTIEVRATIAGHGPFTEQELGAEFELALECTS